MEKLFLLQDERHIGVTTPVFFSRSVCVERGEY